MCYYTVEQGKNTGGQQNNKMAGPNNPNFVEKNCGIINACIFPRPYGARKNTTQLAKYPLASYAKPSNKVY